MIQYDDINWYRRTVKHLDIVVTRCVITSNGVKTEFHHSLYEDEHVWPRPPELYARNGNTYDLWYHDEKHKCWRRWDYNESNLYDLIYLQNALWNCLHRKRLKNHKNTCTTLSRTLPTRTVHVISDFAWNIDDWDYYVYEKKRLVVA